MLDEVGDPSAEGEYKQSRAGHPDRAADPLAGTHKWTETQELDHDEIIHEDCSEQNDQCLGEHLITQLTVMPGLAPESGLKRKIFSPPGPAAKTMPSETPNFMVLGLRFATSTVSFPTRSSGV